MQQQSPRLVEVLKAIFAPMTRNITVVVLDTLAWDLKCMLQYLAFTYIVLAKDSRSMAQSNGEPALG